MKNLKKLLFNLSRNIRRNLSVHRKYPVNPEDAEKLEVLDYSKSKKNYRRIFVCGNIQTGALGMPYIKKGEKDDRLKYIKSPKRLSFGEKFEVTSVAAGFGFSIFAVKSNTALKVYGTGLNTDAQIGYHAVRKGYPLEIIFSPQPIHLPIVNSDSKVLKVSAGRAHSIILTEEGIFLLGNNAYGQCGRYIVSDENYLVSNFIHHLDKIDGKRIVDVECGQDHSLAVTEDGAVYSCGWGADGQTGLGHYNNTQVFTRVCGDIKHEKIEKISCSSDFTLAVNDKGEAFGWGNTEYGQMMSETNKQQLCEPTHIRLLDKLGKMKDVASGRSLCIIVNDEGEVFTWGYGLLGVGPDVQQSLRPIMLPSGLFGRNDFQPDNTVEKVRCGLNHMVAITNNGDVYSWGRNKNCCLGLGTDKDQYFPLKVSMGGLAKEVACGADHTIFVCKPFI